MDLYQFRQVWETKEYHEIESKKNLVEKQVNVLKRRFLSHELNMKNFYRQYEPVALQLDQLKRLLKIAYN
jgi:hypothetical protein